ncbi:MAG: fatty acid desaturase [Pseudomonadota bacterium]
MIKREHPIYIFKYSCLDSIPSIMGIVLFLFHVFLIYYFNERAIFFSLILGCIYSVILAWNINVGVHNFTHLPYFKKNILNRIYSVIQSINVGFSVAYFKYSHREHHSGNNDKVNAAGNTKDPLSFYKYSKNGNPENPLKYALYSFFRSDVSKIWSGVILRLIKCNRQRDEIHQYLSRNKKDEANFVDFESLCIIIFLLCCAVYNWKALIFYMPFYIIGYSLNSLTNYYEHLNANSEIPMAWGVSSYNKLYNWLWLNNGYHAEHHYRPKMHWTKLKALHEEISEQQKRAGVHVISVCHPLGFLAKENKKSKM